jgi:hypothetical protein
MCDSVTCDSVSRVLGSTVIVSPTRTNLSPPFPTTTFTAKGNCIFRVENSNKEDNDDKDTSSDMETCSLGSVPNKSNVILPWLQLLQFMSKRLCCQTCKQTLPRGILKRFKLQSLLGLIVFVLAALPITSKLRQETPWDQMTEPNPPTPLVYQTSMLSVIFMMSTR